MYIHRHEKCAPARVFFVVVGNLKRLMLILLVVDCSVTFWLVIFGCLLCYEYY